MNLLKKVSCAALLGIFSQVVAAADSGHDLYMKRGCYQCHGTVGQGSIAGPNLLPKLMPYAAFAIYVRTPANQMPPFSEKVLSDAELRSVHAYLASLPASPAADSISLLPKAGGK